METHSVVSACPSAVISDPASRPNRCPDLALLEAEGHALQHTVVTAVKGYQDCGRVDAPILAKNNYVQSHRSQEHEVPHGGGIMPSGPTV